MPTLEGLKLDAREILDSRGRPTVRVRASLGQLSAQGDVPAGASKGRDEARTVDVSLACSHVRKALAPLLQGLPGDAFVTSTVLAADAAMAKAAGDNFAGLGANATLPTSRALWQLLALGQKLPLWQVLRSGYGAPVAAARPPVCLFNVFNGGLHALRPGEVLGRERIDLQEIMVVPLQRGASEALACADAIDQALAARLAQAYGKAAVGRGDEAGLSVAGLGSNHAAIDHVAAAIADVGLRPGTDVGLALDVAASSLRAPGGYRLEGKTLSSAAMLAWLEGLLVRYPGLFVSIEDGLDEDDWEAWPELTATLVAHGIRSVGDDLFVTQAHRLSRGIASRAADAILVKVNQNGTVGGTLAVVRQAAEAGLAAVVSHRSGETLDDSIADLAVATGAWGLKAGAPQPPAAFADRSAWVRRAKYLRLAAIEGSGPPA